MRTDVVVLGGGMVGVSAALHLTRRGRSVILVERRQSVGAETSHGNTGIVQSEAVYPYTFPRRLGDILRAGLNLDPRAQIRYSALPAIAPFVFRYFLASSPEARGRSGLGLRALVERAVDEHLAVAEPAGAGPLLRSGGWIKVFRSEAGRNMGMREAEEVAGFGVPFHALNRAELLDLEPHVGAAAISGVHFSHPLTTPNPTGLVECYAKLFEAEGGRVIVGDASTLAQSGDGWQVTTREGPLEAREVVIALGPWSDALARTLGYDFPFGVKRGYHMHYAPRGNASLTRPVLDFERGYVVTPMVRGLRLTTGAEFADVNDPPSPAHLDRLEPFGREMFPLGERLDKDPWLGRRPCLPDMLPVIGRAPRHKGLWFDFGHQHLGLTLGPVSGRLLAEMMTGEAPSVDPAPYRAERYAI